ncbi:MAG TPA: bacillithiol biosynthesis deacetylase BshB1 [Planctomycetota bacterium]|nr:bacillithiol biosynthesis deacetylase BshB1 [Planctomycetota bacterium]
MQDSIKLDLLVLSPHPDDAELLCGGVLLKAKRAGKKIGVVDLTEGEMGTRGSIAIRRKEIAAASALIGLDARENLRLRDGHLIEDAKLLSALVGVLRKYRPTWVLAPHWEDQHPDHEALGSAIAHAAFLAGVPKFHPKSGRGVASADGLPYRPRQVWHYNNRYGIAADLVVDISDVFEQKMELARCYASQFGPGNSSVKKKAEPQTRLSHGHFEEWLRGMHAFYGQQIGVRYGEAYCVKGPLRVDGEWLF